MGYRKPTYEVDGHTFTLKKTSIQNRDDLAAVMDGSGEDAPDLGKIDSMGGILSAFDEYGMMFRIFCCITEGPHDKLDINTFDAKVGEYALADFFPSQTATALRQIGFLPM